MQWSFYIDYILLFQRVIAFRKGKRISYISFKILSFLLLSVLRNTVPSYSPSTTFHSFIKTHSLFIYFLVHYLSSSLLNSVYLTISFHNLKALCFEVWIFGCIVGEGKPWIFVHQNTFILFIIYFVIVWVFLYIFKYMKSNYL